jgi:hypothetical protein
MKRHLSQTAAWAAALFLLLGTADGQNKPDSRKEPKKKGKYSIMVPGFENVSGVNAWITYEVDVGTDPKRPTRRFRVDRYSEAPRGILEDVLINVPGVSVIERQRLDLALLEVQRGQLSGVIDEATAVRLGKMLGANAILMGSILSVKEKKSEFKGPRIRTKTVKVESRVRVRLVQIEKGTSEWSKILRGSETYFSSQFGGMTDSDVAYEVIEAALEQLREDKSFREAVLGKTSEDSKDEIEVEFAPVPDNCDIEVDRGKGFVYEGGSPLKLKLPTGRVILIRISKQGYIPRELKIEAKRGLRITPELVKK